MLLILCGVCCCFCLVICVGVVCWLAWFAANDSFLGLIFGGLCFELLGLV